MPHSQTKMFVSSDSAGAVKVRVAVEGERWFDLSRWGGDVMASELKAYVDYEKTVYL